MGNVRRWSSSASGNATVSGGVNTINFAEGQAPSTVNNSAREMMAQIRGIYTPSSWGWVEHSATASVVNQTSFKLTGNQTSDWTAGKRWRLKSGSTTRYGQVVSSSYTTETTITVTVDSGSLSASHSLAALAAVDGTQISSNITPVSVKSFGAVGDGVTNDTAAIQAAVDAVSVNGGCVYFPRGTYLLTGTAGSDGIVTGINVPYTGAGIQGAAKSIILKGEGSESILKANSSNMYVVRFSTNNSSIQDLSFVGNDTSTGLALVGSTTTGTLTSQAITHNTFTRLMFGGFGENAILLQSPIGTGNGVYYNNFSDIYVYFNQTASGTVGGRGIYLNTATSGTGNQNRNRFSNITFSRLNTGIEINDGDTNVFYNCSFEDVTKGTYPNATPTALIVGSGTISTVNNRFFGLTSETCTRSLLNNNAYSEFYGCLLWTGAITLTQNPLTWVGGYDGSAVPTIFNGWKIDANTTGVSVNNAQLNAGTLRLFDSANGRSRSTRLMGTLSAISNTATKTLTITFDSALDTTAAATLLIEVTFTGINSTWNATGVKRIVTSGELASNKASISSTSDTSVISAGSLGTAGYVTRSTITPSTTSITVDYVFNAAGSGTSVVNYDVEVMLASSSSANVKAFTLAWS